LPRNPLLTPYLLPLHVPDLLFFPPSPQVYRRYLKLEPTHAEEFIAYLKIKQLWGEAAKVRLLGWATLGWARLLVGSFGLGWVGCSCSRLFALDSLG
jgi:hypothetical protein